jgi:beta-glucosidase/6-phospho-beta-glucosidase/beta-galactosidase
MDKISETISVLKELEMQINRTVDAEVKITLLVEHAKTYSELNRHMIDKYNTLLSECITRYDEAVKLATIFQDEMLIMSKLLKLPQPE